VCFRLFVCESELRLGYRPSSSEKEFLSAPIHSPLSGSPFRSLTSKITFIDKLLGYDHIKFQVTLIGACLDGVMRKLPEPGSI
jgi:hypothetical protein